MKVWWVDSVHWRSGSGRKLLGQQTVSVRHSGDRSILTTSCWPATSSENQYRGARGLSKLCMTKLFICFEQKLPAGYCGPSQDCLRRRERFRSSAVRFPEKKKILWVQNQVYKKLESSSGNVRKAQGGRRWAERAWEALWGRSPEALSFRLKNDSPNLSAGNNS